MDTGSGRRRGQNQWERLKDGGLPGELKGLKCEAKADEVTQKSRFPQKPLAYTVTVMPASNSSLCKPW